jgi:hypothetical protein
VVAVIPRASESGTAILAILDAQESWGGRSIASSKWSRLAHPKQIRRTASLAAGLAISIEERMICRRLPVIHE